MPERKTSIDSEFPIHDWFFVPRLWVRIVFFGATLGGLVAAVFLAVLLFYKGVLFWVIMIPTVNVALAIIRRVDVLPRHYRVTSTGLWVAYTGVFLNPRCPPTGYTRLVCWDDIAAVTVKGQTLWLRHVVRRRGLFFRLVRLLLGFARLLVGLRFARDVSVRIDEAEPVVIETIQQLVLPLPQVEAGSCPRLRLFSGAAGTGLSTDGGGPPSAEIPASRSKT